jgi:hypothetical protein
MICLLGISFGSFIVRFAVGRRRVGRAAAGWDGLLAVGRWLAGWLSGLGLPGSVGCLGSFGRCFVARYY